MDVTRHMEVPLINSLNCNSAYKDISDHLNSLPRNKINNRPWPGYQDKPECAFAIAYAPDSIFLKFFVVEDYLLARFTQPNDWVFQDSCVEFFISFENDLAYYNLEFNCIGTCYVAYGKTKECRQVADINIVKMIKSWPLLYNEGNKIQWELTLMIPSNVFYNHQDLLFTGKSAKANFYKCGENLPVPHYLSWENVVSPLPDFHQPQYFGKLNFAFKQYLHQRNN